MRGDHSPKTGQQPPAQSPERASPFAEIEHSELIGMYFESRGDLDIGWELGIRMYEHAGYEGDPETAPIPGHEDVMLADYINFARKNPKHRKWLPVILDFLETEEGSPEYEEGRTRVLNRANGLVEG